jgi:hypothetical protein
MSHSGHLAGAPGLTAWYQWVRAPRLSPGLDKQEHTERQWRRKKAPKEEGTVMVFSPFTIPSQEEHEQDLRTGKTRVTYQELVAVLTAIDEAEEELLSAVAGGHPYVRPLEAGQPEHP